MRVSNALFRGGVNIATYLRQLKRRLRKTQKVRYSNALDATKRAAKRRQVHAVYRDYLSKARALIGKAAVSMEALARHERTVTLTQLQHYIGHARRQIDQIERRVLQGEVIAHEEKVFSIFEAHTEWVCKGKAGVPVELGVRVAVMEDQYQFILHHRIMWRETDDKVALAMVAATQQRFPQLTQGSFDKGFYTPGNLTALDGCLDKTILPKKGRLAEAESLREHSQYFIQARRQHCAIESCINNLEGRGLDRCLSYGKHGFERHVALSVVASNLHRLGLILQRQERARLEKQARYKRRVAP